MEIKTVADLYNFATIDQIHVMINHANPSNILAGREIPEITEWPYCDAIEILQMNDIAIIETILEKRLQMKPDELMNISAAEFTSFFKHIANEIEKIAEFLSMLKSEPEIDLVLAGIENLDKFGVYNIYYAIDKNPANWDEISEISFNKMFTKLLMDKEHSAIQKRYNEIQKQKAKNGHS